jgi:hypothetical protein
MMFPPARTVRDCERPECDLAKHAKHAKHAKENQLTLMGSA